tara:strand:- start:442 stop:1107 length:666 start_codon:yes stop_codon:yes gene_type:complete
MFTMDSTYIVNLGFTLLIAGIITYYFRQQLETANHKIASMFSIVSSLTQEVNNLKYNNGVSYSNNDTSNIDEINSDDRIHVPDDLETKKIKITENSDDEDSEEDSYDDDDSSEDEDEEQENEEDEEDEDEEKVDEEVKENDDNVIKEESLTVIKNNGEEQLMNLEDITKTDIKEITISEDNVSNDLASKTVPELKKLVSEKKLVPNVKNLKKQELLDLLSK